MTNMVPDKKLQRYAGKVLHNRRCGNMVKRGFLALHRLCRCHIQFVQDMNSQEYWEFKWSNMILVGISTWTWTSRIMLWKQYWSRLNYHLDVIYGIISQDKKRATPSLPFQPNIKLTCLITKFSMNNHIGPIFIASLRFFIW